MVPLAPSAPPPARPVADWHTDRVTLVLPTPEMHAYNPDLSALELLYADFAREIARWDRVECIVPDDATAEKLARLSGLPPESFPRASLPDLWIRDFAPIEVAGGRVQFGYRPLYGRRDFSEKVERAFATYLTGRGLPFRVADLNLEGGNFVHNGAGVAIASEKLFAMNRGVRRAEVVERLECALELERLVIVPVEPGDRTGHVDGMLRFLDERRLAVNGFGDDNAGRAFAKKLGERLDSELPDLERLELPYVWSEAKSGAWYDVRGNYANFLRTANRLYVPVYGLPEDALARSLFDGWFPDRVSYVDARAISRYGGSLNCITWNTASGSGAR